MSRKRTNIYYIPIVVACSNAPMPDPKYGLQIIGNGSDVPFGGLVNYRCRNNMRLDLDFDSDTFSLPCLESNQGSFGQNIQWPTCVTCM